MPASQQGLGQRKWTAIGLFVGGLAWLWLVDESSAIAYLTWGVAAILWLAAIALWTNVDGHVKPRDSDPSISAWS